MIHPNQLEANRRNFAKLKQEGWKKVTVWISPEAQVAVAEMKEKHGSFNAGLEALARQ